MAATAGLGDGFMEFCAIVKIRCPLPSLHHLSGAYSDLFSAPTDADLG
jgi:hypothetical protein